MDSQLIESQDTTQDSIQDLIQDYTLDNSQENINDNIQCASERTIQESTQETNKFRSDVHTYFNKTDIHYICKSCSKSYAKSGGTRRPLEHVKKHHGKIFQKQKASASVYEMIITRTGQSRYRSIEEAVSDLIVQNHLSFKIVESDALANLVSFCNSSVKLPNRKSIRDYIESDYRKKKTSISDLIRCSSFPPHLTIDGWTSSNQVLSLLGVTIHFSSPTHGLVSTVLSCNDLDGPHTGQNLADAIIQILDTFEIGQLGCIVADNASNMDAMACALEDLIGWSSESNRLRCCGHIINLVVNAFWLYKKANAEDNGEERHETTLFGVWGKISNICKYIRSSHQRRENFLSISPKMVLIANSTRWNSGLSMLKTAYDLKDYIDVFVNRSRDLVDTRMSQDDWEVVQTSIRILSLFEEATLMLQKQSTTLHMVIPYLKLLANVFSQTIAAHTHLSVVTSNEIHMQIINACKSGQTKLEKYSAKINESNIYLSAVVLDPMNKLDYFIENGWTVEATDIIRSKVFQFWKSNYASVNRNVSEPDESTTTFSSVHSWKKRKVVTKDEMELYLSAPTELEVENVWEWWNEKRKTYPYLSGMALDILAIPAMSAESERLFSSAKQVTTDRRSRLSADTVNELECLRAWSKLL